MRRGALTVLAFLQLVAVARAAGTPIPPVPARWLTDTAGFLSSARREQLDGRLEAYQKQSGHQIVVWIGDTIEGSALDDWAVRTFAAWKIGRKGLDDGIVMFILARDRKIDIEVGYGLEGQVPDAVANRIIQDVMAPLLRADDRDGSAQAGVDAILAAIEGRPVGDLGSGSGAGGPVTAPKTPQLILIGLAILAFLVLLVVNPRLAMWFLWSLASAGRGGGGGGGFQGGGGRSGGGGARGSW